MNQTNQHSNNLPKSLYQFIVQLMGCFILAVIINFVINFSGTMFSGQSIHRAHLQKAQDYQVKLNQQYPLLTRINTTINNKLQRLLSGQQKISDLLTRSLPKIPDSPFSNFSNPNSWLTLKNKLKVYGILAILSFKISLEKMLTWLAGLPLFLILSIVAFIDGFIQRSIRRSCGGHESSLLYHHTKQLITAILLLSLLCCVVLPYPPQWILLPGALLFSFSVFLTTKTFKKYI